jgi:3-dehydro-4-phosphotetronate decarboxylase
MTAETDLRAAIVKWSRSLFERGLTGGSSGNITVRLAEGFLATPTNSCLGFLDPDRLSRLDAAGALLSGDPPTKELPLHFAFYHNRPSAQAVVHLHSTYATALSCLGDVDQLNAVPPITPYVVMRVGRVPVLPYARPGSADLAPGIARCAADSAAVLLANHGPVVAGRSLEEAMFAIEELEEAAKLAIITRRLPVRYLDAAAIDELNAHFRLR